MEIEAKDGTTTIPLNQTSTTDFGRGLGFNNTNDRTVSRRHVTFKPQSESESMVRFEVIGRNPMWVRSGRNGETKFFRSGDEGEMEGGDLFCVSGKTPVWFGLKSKKGFEDEVFERLETSSSSNGASVTSFEPVDVSDTDPVKEFGFLVMGHEFDCYSTQMIRDMKNWNWFLEEARKDSDDEDVSEKKGRRSVKKKRKNDRGIDDDDDDGEWTGESEDDKDLISKPRKFPKPNYSTRSKHCSSKPPHDSKNSTKNDVPRKSLRANEEESEDEDEETLGGFIVDEEDVEREEESEEDEEEEFDEDDDDEEIND